MTRRPIGFHGVVVLMVAIACLGLAGAHTALADANGAAVAIRPDHQAEDLSRLLDQARQRGQAIVVRIEPAAGTPADHGSTLTRDGRSGAAALDWWRSAADAVWAGLSMGVQGIPALPGLADAFARSWRGLRNAASSGEALARLAAVIVGALAVGLLARALADAVLRLPPPTSFAVRLGAASLRTLGDGLG